MGRPSKDPWPSPAFVAKAVYGFSTARQLMAESEQKIYLYIDFGEQQFKVLAYVAKQRAQLERSFRTAVADIKQSQKERQGAKPISRNPRKPRRPTPTDTRPLSLRQPEIPLPPWRRVTVSPSPP